MGNGFQKFDLNDVPPKQELTVELVPQSAWGQNLRSALKKSEWDKLRKKTYADADYHCEICGGQGWGHSVECHEVWDYDDRNHIQKLVRLIALCPDCHRVKHFGKAQLDGKEAQALAQMRKVNGWTTEQAREHIKKATLTWYERSNHEWTLDLSWLKENGVGLLTPPVE